MEIRRRRESSALQRTARTLPLTESSFRTASRWGSASGASDPQAMPASRADGKGTLRVNRCGRFPGLLAPSAAAPSWSSWPLALVLPESAACMVAVVAEL